MFKSPLIALLVTLISVTSICRAESRPEAPTNKLLYMYKFFYLPFSVDFREGKTPNDILPLIESSDSSDKRLIKADELQRLDEEWTTLKEPFKKKSLFLTTAVPLNGSVRISSHLASHRIMISRTAFDTLGLNERILVKQTLKGKPPEVQANYKQLLFIKSLLGPEDTGKFNFIVVSASWCESCREYRTMFEDYFRAFLPEGVNIHSLVIEDTKEQIFEHPLLKELFPNDKKYSHNSIPRFLAIETVNDSPVVYEEGDALKELYERFFSKRRGYLDAKSTLFGVKPIKKPISIRRLASPNR